MKPLDNIALDLCNLIGNEYEEIEWTGWVKPTNSNEIIAHIVGKKDNRDDLIVVLRGKLKAKLIR